MWVICSIPRLLDSWLVYVSKLGVGQFAGQRGTDRRFALIMRLGRFFRHVNMDGMQSIIALMAIMPPIAGAPQLALDESS